VQARVKVERAKERLERARKLVERSALSRDELDNLTSEHQALSAEYENQKLIARSGLASARMKHEALAMVRQELADTRIAAPPPATLVPASGSPPSYAVIGRHVSEGTFLRVGTEVFKLVIDQTLKLRVPVPDRYAAEVKEGQSARITTAASPQEFAGTVTRINPGVDTATRTFEVEIQVPNAEARLKSGSFAKAAVVTRFDQETATVPLEAVIRFAGITKLFVVENGRAKEVPVRLGVVKDRWAEIAEPRLPKDAVVVVSGQNALADGTGVYVRTPAALAEGRASTGGAPR
jgi:RND family efflux transporter MFP subunit